MRAHFGAHTCVQVLLDKAICDESALARYVRFPSVRLTLGSQPSVCRRHSAGGNDDVQRNAHSAVSNDEKASTHELGRGH